MFCQPADFHDAGDDVYNLGGKENNTENKPVSHVPPAVGVHFSMQYNSWMPSQGCLKTNIPVSLPSAAQKFVLTRQNCSDVRHLPSGIPYVSPEGYMLGPDCIPTTTAELCPQCSTALQTAHLLDDGIFVLRTYMGAVLRRKKTIKCQCGWLAKWDPNTEFIYTIRSDSEGGLYFDVLIHDTLQCFSRMRFNFSNYLDIKLNTFCSLFLFPRWLGDFV